MLAKTIRASAVERLTSSSRARARFQEDRSVTADVIRKGSCLQGRLACPELAAKSEAHDQHHEREPDRRRKR